MPEQDNKKTPAPKKPPKASGEAENLLNEFGAAPKKSTSKPLPPVQNESKRTAASEKPEGTGAAPKKADAPKKNDAPKAAPKKADGEKKPHTEKDGSAKKSEPKNEARASTADSMYRKKERSEKVQKEKPSVDLNLPRSARTEHRVIPYVLIIFAVLIGVALILNVVWFAQTGGTDPEAHPMGLFGYYISYGLFGVFGPAVFTLPLLLVNLAFYWRRYIDNRCAVPKVLVSVAFLLLAGAIIHVFCLQYAKDTNPEYIDLGAAELMRHGADMTGGGVLGGLLGAWMMRFCNFAGALIIGIVLLGVSLFYLLGMTPEHLWEQFRLRRHLNRRTPGISEQDAEDAKLRAAMDEKIRRTTGKQMNIDDEQFTHAPEGAVVVEREKPKKNPEDKLAPMPKPHLNPGQDHRVFVPADVTRRLREEERARAAGQAPVAPQRPTAPTAPAQQAPAAPIDPAQNRDAAVDPIFPKTADSKQARRVPREDRNFDLKNVFVNLDDREPSRPRPHAPVPPEVPPRANGQPTPAATQRPAAPQRPAMQASPAVPNAAQRPAVRQPAAQRPVGQAPSLGAVKPQAPSKTIFRQAEKGGAKDYGLTSEEFEKLEAGRVDLKPAKAAGKPADKTAEKASTDKKDAAPSPKTTSSKKYVFPPISYLQPGVPMTEENRAEIEESMRQLAATLESFHVKVQEINYSCGPTVTRYEVVLAPGVRVRTVTNLADDIALSLRSSGGVRIEAPIPGTNAVGIEVPNRTRSTIYLRDLIECKEFQSAKSKLAACLGADIAGQPVIFDIAKMPHLLIAGTTGSGKSVCINCIIMSLFYKVRPDEVKLVLIDPKKVEFSPYKNIPHLMAPVVTQPKDAAGALQAAVEEMERRFEVFEEVGVRDLKGYNEITKDDPDMPYIPHIVIIIDELADLMMTAKNEVETAICRIAQKARAAGMHLIIGTQRPSADVVTGLIKANVPSSIACAVKSQIDSRVILDHGGAEALTGRGDMLFVPIGAMRDTRVQGAFVDDKEVEKISEFLRASNGPAQYDERFTAKLKELAAQCGSKGKASDDVPMSENGDRGDDPKYADAVRVAIEEKRVATSLLQRKLGVGYSRAAKMIDRMFAEGIVSAPDGSKPRSILITPEEYIARFVDGKEEDK